MVVVHLLQVFRKYGHSLGPESLEFLEEILEQHDIPQEDVEFSVEWIAREYNKQDGECFLQRLVHDLETLLDAQMKVSLDVLKRVYDSFQTSDGQGQGDGERLDPESHLYFINAFNMPLWNWSQEKSAFERCGTSIRRCLGFTDYSSVLPLL